ncbi:MAG: ATP-binding cassette domain-containing protein [Spirochaetia bacterium]|jgi:ABC-2 type transport system ATP-binding protein
MAIITIKGLRKSFRTRRGKGRPELVHAVDGIDLSVEDGEIFGFLGPNGAGKSTTLRILSTLLSPDDGSVAIAGFDMRAEPREVRRQIGYVSQAGGTDPLASGRENMILQARLYGLSTAEARRRSEELIDALALSAFVDRFAKTYSGGQRRKIDIAVGMVHSPKILFLDEPTTGLDPVSRSQLWGQIRLLRKLGTTVFLTTHYMEEADALCDRIAIIDHGRIVSEGSPTQLKHGIEGDILSITVNHVENAPQVAMGVLRDLPLVREIKAEGGNLRLVVSHGGEALPVVIRLLEGKGIGVADIALSRPSLDDVFLRATGHSLKDEGALAASTRSTT